MKMVLGGTQATLRTFDVVKWWLLPISLALGVLIGFALYHLVYFASTNDLVRQLEGRIKDLERSSRDLEGTIVVLRGQLAEGKKLVDGVTSDNQKLRDDLARANDKAQRIRDEIQRGAEILGDIGRTNVDITDTIGRIERIVSEIERLYRYVGDD